jgi:hypothetical protein
LILFLADYLKTETKKNVLYFDTEQSEYHLSKALNRICIKNGFVPENIKAYHLRSKATDERLALIEQAIYENDNYDIVIIDGIRDLINSINDEEQATMINSKLLKWTEEKNIHIITVLHQNKGDNNARGHVGTELMNKAELVLSVTRSEEEKNTSYVETVVCRNIEIDEFAFSIDENGIPNIVDEWAKKPKTTQSRKMQVSEIPKETYKLIISKAFEKEPKLKYKELQEQLDLAIQNISKIEMGTSKIQLMITHLANIGLIEKIGKDKSPTAFYQVKEIEAETVQNELDLDTTLT